MKTIIGAVLFLLAASFVFFASGAPVGDPNGAVVPELPDQTKLNLIKDGDLAASAVLVVPIKGGEFRRVIMRCDMLLQIEGKTQCEVEAFFAGDKKYKRSEIAVTDESCAARYLCKCGRGRRGASVFHVTWKDQDGCPQPLEYDVAFGKVEKLETATTTTEKASVAKQLQTGSVDAKTPGEQIQTEDGGDSGGDSDVKTTEATTARPEVTTSEATEEPADSDAEKAEDDTSDGSDGSGVETTEATTAKSEVTTSEATTKPTAPDAEEAEQPSNVLQQQTGDGTSGGSGSEQQKQPGGGAGGSDAAQPTEATTAKVTTSEGTTEPTEAEKVKKTSKVQQQQTGDDTSGGSGSEQQPVGGAGGSGAAQPAEATPAESSGDDST